MALLVVGAPLTAMPDLINGNAAAIRPVSFLPAIPATYHHPTITLAHPGPAGDQYRKAMAVMCACATKQLAGAITAETRAKGIILGAARAGVNDGFRIDHTALAASETVATHGQFDCGASTFIGADGAFADLGSLVTPAHANAYTADEQALMADIYSVAPGVAACVLHSLAVTGHHYLTDQNGAFLGLLKQFGWVARENAPLQAHKSALIAAVGGFATFLDLLCHKALHSYSWTAPNFAVLVGSPEFKVNLYKGHYEAIACRLPFTGEEGSGISAVRALVNQVAAWVTSRSGQDAPVAMNALFERVAAVPAAANNDQARRERTLTIQRLISAESMRIAWMYGVFTGMQENIVRGHSLMRSYALKRIAFDQVAAYNDGIAIYRETRAREKADAIERGPRYLLL